MHKFYILISTLNTTKMRKKTTKNTNKRWQQLYCALTFIVESVDTVDARTLVISTQHEEVLRIFDLVCEQ